MFAAADSFVQRCPTRPTPRGVPSRRNQVGDPAANGATNDRHCRPDRLRFLRSFCLVACALGACGNVTFVDAPFAPRRIAILYSSQEDVTVIRWHMAAEQPDSSVTFELADAAGKWQTINFAGSLFPGGVAPCGTSGGLCGQMVLPGQYRPPANGATPLRALNPSYGSSPGDAPSFTRYIKSLALKSFFLRGNAQLSAKIDDAIGGDLDFLFPRPLERAVWDRRGVCVPGFYPADAPFTPVTGLQQPWPAPPTLSASGRYCAGVRALPRNGARGIDDQVALDTVPVVTDGDHSYTVPTEMTPFTYQIVLDLSIPVSDRCQESISTIQDTVARNLKPPLRAMPVIDLAAAIDPETGMPGTPCRQSPLRALDATGMAQQVKLSAAAWPEQHQRYFLLYFNNLRAPLPPLLTQSLYDFNRELVTPPPEREFEALFWPFGPPEMSQSFAGWGGPITVWTSATDPDFAQQLQSYSQQNLPLISEIQDPLQPIPILSDGDAQQFDGALIRVCTVTISPDNSLGLNLTGHDADGNVTYLPVDYQYVVKKDDPLAYRLDLPPVWAVPKGGFMPHKALLQYEICTQYCDHAFTAESGAQVPAGWIGSSLCLGPPGGAG